MAKTFVTERDVEDLYRQGIRVLDVHNDVVLTDLAREKALALGIRLARGGAATSAAPQSPRQMSPEEISAKVRAAVLTRLGNTVDPALVDVVIARVLAQLR